MESIFFYGNEKNRLRKTSACDRWPSWKFDARLTKAKTNENDGLQVMTAFARENNLPDRIIKGP